jgi:hypothetical protein
MRHLASQSQAHDESKIGATKRPPGQWGCVVATIPDSLSASHATCWRVSAAPVSSCAGPPTSNLRVAEVRRSALHAIDEI